MQLFKASQQLSSKPRRVPIATQTEAALPSPSRVIKPSMVSKAISANLQPETRSIGVQAQVHVRSFGKSWSRRVSEAYHAQNQSAGAPAEQSRSAAVAAAPLPPVLEASSASIPLPPASLHLAGGGPPPPPPLPSAASMATTAKVSQASTLTPYAKLPSNQSHPRHGQCCQRPLCRR